MITFTISGAVVKIWASEIIGALILSMGVYFFWSAQSDKRNPIDLAGMFVWPGTKHTSMAMFLAFWASLIAFWIVIDMELKKELTAEVFLGFLGIFVAGKTATEGINAWRAKATLPDHNGDRGKDAKDVADCKDKEAAA